MSRRIAAGTSSSTMPSLKAFLPGTLLPARMMSSPSWIPMSRGSRCVPPAPGKRPSWISGRPIEVTFSSLATR